MDSKTRIRNLTETCKCGCLGRDPWHQTHYERVVQNVASCRTPLGDDKIVTATGTVRLPWEKQVPVRQIVWIVDGREISLGWEVVR